MLVTWGWACALGDMSRTRVCFLQLAAWDSCRPALSGMKNTLTQQKLYWSSRLLEQPHPALLEEVSTMQGCCCTVLVMQTDHLNVVAEVG